MFMSEDMFAVLMAIMIGLVLIAIVALVLAYSENRRAKHATRKLAHARLQLFELDPDMLVTRNKAYREINSYLRHQVTSGKELLQVYADYATTIEAKLSAALVKAEPRKERPATIELVTLQAVADGLHQIADDEQSTATAATATVPAL